MSKISGVAFVMGSFIEATSWLFLRVPVDDDQSIIITPLNIIDFWEEIRYGTLIKESKLKDANERYHMLNKNMYKRWKVGTVPYTVV